MAAGFAKLRIKLSVLLILSWTTSSKCEEDGNTTNSVIERDRRTYSEQLSNITASASEIDSILMNSFNQSDQDRDSSLVYEHISGKDNDSVAVTASNRGWRCHCWNSTDGVSEELECRCEGSSLTRIPQRLHSSVQKFTMAEAGLQVLRAGGLSIYNNTLQDLVLTKLHSFYAIEAGAFQDLPLLRTIYISHAPQLKTLPPGVFAGITNNFRSLRIIHTGLEYTPDVTPLLTDKIIHLIDLEGNNIKKIEANAFKIKADQLILDYNMIDYVENYAFAGSELAKLSLKGNWQLQHLSDNAFVGIMHITELDLSSTSLESLPPEGLSGLEILRIQDTPTLKTIPSVYNFKNLQKAYLTHSFHCCAFKYPARHDPDLHAKRVAYLANQQTDCHKKAMATDTTQTGGDGEPQQNGDNVKLDNLASLKHSEGYVTKKDVDNEVDNVITKRSLKEMHEKKKPPKGINSLNFNSWGYFHDIVDYANDAPQSGDSYLDPGGQDRYSGPIQSLLTGPDRGDPSGSHRADPLSSPSGVGGTGTSGMGSTSAMGSFSAGSGVSAGDLGEFHQTALDVSTGDVLDAVCGNLTSSVISVQCFPLPDALNPCEDVMGSHWLRASVWIVVITAVFGNVAVLVVLLCSRNSEPSVPRFLMCHLAIADLCMGFYLLLLACTDLHSVGEFFNYAYDWQYGAGCQIAGFLTVFASQLSIFTLTIVTLERWFAITYAIYLNKRIKLKAAAKIMAGGWLYSLAMAALPLAGVSNYSSTSICLPMQAIDSWDVAYLTTLLTVNGLAFVVIVICYAQIYLSLGKETRKSRTGGAGGGRAATAGEMNVAKKMALLVFTDFACWAPIAFFGLTAIAGFPLIDVTRSKILLVFFYPLNSCANPYLYAILTAQYRRDMYVLLAKYGICTKKAQQLKMAYSMPTTNNSNPLPIPLMSSNRNGSTADRKSSRGNNNVEEAFV